MKRLFIASLVLAVLTGCASGPPRIEGNDTLQRYLRYAGDPVDRFNTMTGIDSWESVDSSHIVLRTGFNKAYLITLWSGCPDVDFANRIRVVSTMSNSVSRLDKVIVGREQCAIREIRPVDIRQMKVDQSTTRQKEREKRS